MNLLLPTSYLPPISYVKKVLDAEHVYLESHEHFVKQTIRSRCEILGANGRLKLTIPVSHNDRREIPIAAVTIANNEAWQRQHLKSIESAYGKSPYFEFYEDDLRVILMKDYSLLTELNSALLKLIFKWLKKDLTITNTTAYTPNPENLIDLRSHWNENHHPADCAPYQQVFSAKHGFIPDLSIIDLIFNAGPEAHRYLQR